MLSSLSLVLLTMVTAAGKTSYEVARFVEHYAPVTSVVAAPENEAVSVGLDGRLRRWDLTTGEPRGEKPVNAFTEDEQKDEYAQLAISKNGELLAAVWCNDILYLGVRAYPKAAVFKHGEQPELHAAAFSPDGRLLASGDDNGSVALFDTSNTYKNGTFTTHNKDKVRDLVAKGKIASLRFTGDSKSLLALGKLEKDYALQILNPADGKLRVERVADGPALAIAPNGKSFVTGRAVWNLADVKPQAALRHYFALNSAAYSPDSQWLVTGGDENRLIFWDPQTGQKLAMLRAHDDRIRSIALTSDGKFVVSASDDMTARVWDVARILADKPMDEPLTKLAGMPRAYDAWRLGLCWAQGTRTYQPGNPSPRLLAEAQETAKRLGIQLPELPQEVDLSSLVEYLHKHQEPLAEEMRKKFDQAHGELFLAGAFLPTIQIFFDPSNEGMKAFRDDIMPDMGKQFAESFGTLPSMFERVESDLTEQVDQETMQETIGMLIREIDLYLEAQSKTKK